MKNRTNIFDIICLKSPRKQSQSCMAYYLHRIYHQHDITNFLSALMRNEISYFLPLAREKKLKKKPSNFFPTEIIATNFAMIFSLAGTRLYNGVPMVKITMNEDILEKINVSFFTYSD